MDAIRASTRTIWLVAAGVFALAALVSLFKGSVIFALLLVLITAGCVVMSRRAPEDDGGSGLGATTEEDAEDDEGDEPASNADQRQGDAPRQGTKRLWSEDRPAADEADDADDPPRTTGPRPD